MPALPPPNAEKTIVFPMVRARYLRLNILNAEPINNLLVVEEFGNGGRQAQRLEARDARQDPSEDQTGPSALAERTGPESPEPRDAVHEVGFVGLREGLRPALGHDRDHDPLRVGGLHGVEGGLPQPAVDAQARAGAHLHVDVGRAVFHGETQQPVEIQHLRASSVTPIGPVRTLL
jgi:hypothetical protein